MSDPRDAAHRVVAVVREPQGPFELGCIAEVFGTHRSGIAGRYDLQVCTEHPGQVMTTFGIPMTVTHGLSALTRADTIIIAGWRPVDTLVSPAFHRALNRAHARGCRIATICSGAFALAQTGLLDGRRATTHWAGAADLQRRAPRVKVDSSVLFIDHGDIATSGGAGAGIDLCLHLVRKDHGASYAAAVARHMVMPPHRDGGQAQYAVPMTGPPPPSLSELLDWISARLDAQITLQDLADYLHVSPRTLARRFTEQLGTSPRQWILAQRITAARTLLEETDLPVDTIATRVGLASATNLGRRFSAAMHTTPAAYRRIFRAHHDNPEQRISRTRPRRL